MHSILFLMVIWHWYSVRLWLKRTLMWYTVPTVRNKQGMFSSQLADIVNSICKCSHLAALGILSWQTSIVCTALGTFGRALIFLTNLINYGSNTQCMFPTVGQCTTSQSFQVANHMISGSLRCTVKFRRSKCNEGCDWCIYVTVVSCADTMIYTLYIQ